MQINRFEKLPTVTKWIALLSICLCGPDTLAQSGSRGAAPVGSGSRLLTPAAPAFQPSSQPFAAQPSFASPQNFAPVESFAPVQNFAPVENFTPVQNFAPAESFSTPQAFGTAQPAMPTQSFMSQPTGTDANVTGASSSLGIPQSSLVDPVFETHDPYSQFSVDHSPWDAFLQRYLVTGPRGVNRIKYGQVTACDRHRLNSYLQQLQCTDVRALNRDEQLAFWFNLYNAKTTSIVLQHYPIRSIRQIKQKFTDFVGPFDDPGVVNVLGKPLSLNDIESGIIRPIWKDPRIHYAVNCASFGCPNLPSNAWTASNIDARLNSAAYNFVNSGRAVKSGCNGIRLSKIYKWYKDDFGGDEQSVLAHIRQYANGPTSNLMCNCTSISGYFYDWSLNDGKVTRRRLLESWRR